MNKGVLLRLQTWRRAVARTLIAAFVLPALLGLLPKLPLSADQALAQAIMESVCDASGQQAPGHAPMQHDQSCVLCAVGCGVAHAADLPNAIGIEPWHALNSKPLDIVHAATAQPAAWRTVVVPRGPPTV